VADVEIMARVERRRKWSAREKAALLAEVEAEGGKVTVVARRHRISESVLYNWRAAWKAAAAVMQAPVAPPFIPLGVIGGSTIRDPAMLT
jgi:transposase